MTKIIKVGILALLETILLSTLYGEDTLWLRRFDRGTDEYGTCVVLDRSDNSIIAGHSWSTITNGYDILLIKYTPSGDTIWTKYYDGGESEGVIGVNLDRQGNIVSAGWSANDTIESQCMVAKFSPEGNFLWKRKYRIGDIDGFCAVAFDNSNGIILAGVSYSYSGGGRLIGLMRKYDSAGNLIWTKLYNWSREFWGLTAMPNGDFFATGADTFGQMLTVRFDSLGDTIWTKRYSWGGCDCRGWGVTLDSFGNVIVAGYLRDGLLFDFGIIKYTQDGDTVWTRTVDFSPNDWATDVATDVLGNIYVCGNSGVIDTCDYRLVKYTPGGDTIWTKRYDNGYDDVAYGVVVDSYGNPIVTGCSSNSTDYDIVTIKYRGTPGIEERSMSNTKQLVFEIYPNPAKSFFTIRLPQTADHQSALGGLKIFDVSGTLIKEIATLPSVTRNDRIGEIKISLKGINPGIYFLQLGTETKKFLVVK